MASRFIINVPVEERSNLIRICFQVELAHWFYLDFFCASEDDLVPCGIKLFAGHIFKHVPFLRPHVCNLDRIMEDWKKYKLSVPTYGAILVSADLNHVLLVQSFWAKSSWGFPKGKVNENEDPVHCAVREVYEETGFDSSQLISPTDFFESIFNYQFTRLYVVAGVPMDAEFIPRTRNEIKSCDWFPIDLLPNHKTDADCKTNLGMNANSFFMVMPFIKKLKRWVANRRELRKQQRVPKSDSKVLNNNNKRQRHKSMGDIENLWQGVNSGVDTTFYQSSSSTNVPSGSKTVAKCGDTPAHKQTSTPVEGGNAKRTRDKPHKLNIKRQLFGPDATSSSTEHGTVPTSPSPLNFSFTNFPVVKNSTGAKSKNTPGQGMPQQSPSNENMMEKKRAPLKKMDVTRFNEWDHFKFDADRISNGLQDFLL